MKIYLRQTVLKERRRLVTPCATLAQARAEAAALLRFARNDGCEVRRTGPMKWTARDGLDVEELHVVVRP